MTDLQIEMMVAMCAVSAAAFKRKSEFDELILGKVTEIHQAHCYLIGVDESELLTYTSKVSGQSFGLQVFEGNRTRLTDFSNLVPEDSRVVKY